ncbi:hypothetical protein [Actinomadura sp. 3N508]|uniref:hypothetical protein n=1 Tax=Actinomadura sp. 3N508 TaxID=3375153 RepID=UPI0037ACBEFB
MPPDSAADTAQQLVGATADITTRHNGAHTAALIYGHHAGRLVLRPAGEWVQIDADDITAGHTHDDTPLADRRTVRVCDRGTSRSYEGITIRAITLVWTCPACGRPRGEPRNGRLIEDGEHYHVHIWDNPCGHIDMYGQCLIEAGVHATRPVKT